MPGSTTTLSFLGRGPEGEDALAGLAPAAQAILRQFSHDRLTGYGLAPADAVELRSAVFGGADWQEAATRLAELVLAQLEGSSSAVGSTADTATARTATARTATTRTATTRMAGLRRASALLRMSQVAMLADSDERRAIFVRAAHLFEEAAQLAGNGRAVLIDTAPGPLAGWLYEAEGEAVGTAIVLGGVEGWAMDFASEGEALAARGIDTLMLDGPGQGETRFVHGHYLGTDWPDAIRGAIDHMARRAPAHEIALVGNSLGGSLALTVAAADPRISACCANGAIVRATPPEGAKGPNLAKMILLCGTDDEQVARQSWARIDPLTPGEGGEHTLLVVQGGKDPAVPLAAAELLLEKAPASAREMVVFSDGDHCVYNHRDDRDALIGDWVRSQLAH